MKCFTQDVRTIWLGTIFQNTQPIFVISYTINRTILNPSFQKIIILILTNRVNNSVHSVYLHRLKWSWLTSNIHKTFRVSLHRTDISTNRRAAAFPTAAFRCSYSFQLLHSTIHVHSGLLHSIVYMHSRLLHSTVHIHPRLLHSTGHVHSAHSALHSGRIWCQSGYDI